MPYNSSTTSMEILAINYNHVDATKCSTVGCRRFIKTTRLSTTDTENWTQDDSNNWYHDSKCKTIGTQPAPHAPTL